MMGGILENESDGYKCNSFDDAISDGALKITSSNSMNEEGNGREEEERGDDENGRKNSYIP
jgi:hypothetical protein